MSLSQKVALNIVILISPAILLLMIDILVQIMGFENPEMVNIYLPILGFATALMGATLILMASFIDVFLNLFLSILSRLTQETVGFEINFRTNLESAVDKVVTQINYAIATLSASKVFTDMKTIPNGEIG